MQPDSSHPKHNNVSANRDSPFLQSSTFQANGAGIWGGKERNCAHMHVKSSAAKCNYPRHGKDLTPDRE